MAIIAPEDVYVIGGFSTSDIAASDVSTFIERSTVELEQLTGRNFNTAAQTATDYISGKDYFREDSGDHWIYETSETQLFQEHVMLAHQNVSTITSVVFLDKDDTVGTTLTVSDDINTRASNLRIGKILFKNHSLPDGDNNIRIVYTYGIDTSEVDLGESQYSLASELTGVLAAIRSFVKISGGTFDDPSGYTFGSRSVSLGEPYINIREAINQLEKRKKELLRLIGERVDIVMV